MLLASLLKLPGRTGEAALAEQPQAARRIELRGVLRVAHQGQQRRRGAGHVMRLVERAGDQVGVIDRVDANRHVRAALDQSFRVVGQTQGYLQVRILAAEIGQQWGDHILAESRWRLDTQLALDAAGLFGDFTLSLFDLTQQFGAVAEVARAGVCQAQGAGVTAEQADAQIRLQIAHAGGHGGIGDVE
ncbi:hypothetical protein D3C84_672770 [compost metagenome]